MAERCRCYDEPDPPTRARCRLCGRIAGPIKHECHAIGCTVSVPPRMLMCRKHWYMIPKPLRDAVWATYVPGQEIRKDPTDEYMDAHLAAVRAVAEKEGRAQPKEPK
jgi:hypothetical protein